MITHTDRETRATVAEMEIAATSTSKITHTKEALEPPDHTPDHSALQRRVLDVALERLAESLASPSELARGVCVELGVAHGDLAEAFRRLQQRCLGDQRLDDACKDPSEVGGGLDSGPTLEGDTTVASPGGGLLSLLVQDLSVAFFSQEVLHGERALGDARARLEALWDKLVELTEERDKTLRNVGATPEKQRLFVLLAQALEHQAQEDQHDASLSGSTRGSADLDGGGRYQKTALNGSRVAAEEGGFSLRTLGRNEYLPLEHARGSSVDGSPSIGSPLAESPTRGPRSGVSPVSRLRPPSAGRRRRSSPSSPVSAPRPRDRDNPTPYSTSPPLQRRRLHSPAQGKISRVRYGNGGASPDRVGQRGEPGMIVPRGMDGSESSATIPDGQEATLDAGDRSHELARLKTEVEGLRGQRDVLTRSVSFAREQYSDALGDKPMQIDRLTREVEQLRRASDRAREDLAEERKAAKEEVARLESDVAVIREEADTVTRWLGEAKTERAAADERAGVSAEHALAAEALQQKAMALEAQSGSMASENQDLQRCLDAALVEMEGLRESNRALRAKAAAARCSEESSRTKDAAFLAEATAERDRLVEDSRTARSQLSRLEAEAVSLRDAEKSATVDAVGLRASLAEARRDAGRAAVEAAATMAAAASAAEDAVAECAARRAEGEAEKAVVEREAWARRYTAEAEAAAARALTEANENLASALEDAKVTAEREAKEADQRASHEAAARELELRALRESLTRLEEDRDQLIRAARDEASVSERRLALSSREAATATEERDAWAVRSGEWEYEATRLGGELMASKNETEDVRQELEMALTTAELELAGAKEGLARVGRLEEEAAAAETREAALRDELETAQAAVRRLTSEAEKAASCTDAEMARANARLVDTRNVLSAAQARLDEIETERDSALKSLLEVAQARTAVARPMLCYRDRGKIVGANCDGSNGGVCVSSRGGSCGTSVSGGGGGYYGGSERGALGDSEQWLSRRSSGLTTLSRRNSEGTIVAREGAWPEGWRPVAVDAARASPGAAPTSVESSRQLSTSVGRDGGIEAEASGGLSNNSVEHVCGVCGAPVPAFGKLVNCRLRLGQAQAEVKEARARVSEAVEGGAAAAEDAAASRCENRALEEDLAESVRELEAARKESRRFSALVGERETAIAHQADEAGTRLAEVQAQLSATGTALARERENSARFSVSSVTSPGDGADPHAEENILNAQLEAVDQMIDDFGNNFDQGGRKLRVSRDHTDTAVARATTARSAVETLARALREAGAIREASEESLRQAKKEAEEGVREAKENTAAAAAAAAAVAAMALAESATAAGEAGQRHAADLAGVERERDTLREKCAELQERLVEREQERSESSASVKRMEEAQADRDEAIRRLTKDSECHHEQMETFLRGTREGLEQRLAEAENAAAKAAADFDSERRQVASREWAAAKENLEEVNIAHRAELREAREAGHAAARAVESRAWEAAEAMAASAAAAQRQELAGLVEVAAARKGEIAALQARLRSAEEDVGAARREGLLEGQAKSLAQATATSKKAGLASAKAEAMQERCAQQEQIIADLASSREEEADACRVARELVSKERSTLVKSEERVRELQLEVGCLSSLVRAAQMEVVQLTRKDDPNRESVDRSKEDSRGGARGQAGGSPAAPRRDNDDGSGNYYGTAPIGQGLGHDAGRKEREAAASPVGLRTSWNVGGRPDQAVNLSAAGFRESKERERARSVVFALEESLHESRDEVEHLKRRVSRLRSGLRDAEQRSNEMEAAAASARASADAKGAAVEALTAEVDSVTARRHEAEQRALAAERREEVRTAALEAEAEASRVTTAAKEALPGEGAATREETSRLRGELGEADRRAAVLEANLAAMKADLRTAEAETARAQMALIREFGHEAEGRGRRNGNFPGLPGDGQKLGFAQAQQRWLNATSIATLPPPPPLPTSSSVLRGDNRAAEQPGYLALSDHYETTTLRDRLVASQAQQSELVRASEEAVARCSQRCEERVRVVVAASTLVSACYRRQGILAGREAAVEAAARLALVKRCFRALREEALCTSRDRSVRRQERIQLWIGESVERAGEELSVTITNINRRRRRAGERDPH